MRLFSNNVVPYTSTEGDKIYPIVVDIKKGIKSGEAISFVTADNQVGVITVDFMDGNSSYSIEGCMVTSTIRRPDGTVLEIPCDIISQSIIEIPLGINGTYQEGVHTFDLKIVRGNGKVIGVPTMSYSVSGSLSSDDVVEGDDRLPVLTMVLDNAQDKLTRLDKAIAGATNDLEVKEARDGEVTLNARLERDLKKGKIHFVDIEGSNISTDSEEGYLENVEIHGNTWQNAENLEDIRSVGTKVEGQELYEIPVLSYGKNLFNGKLQKGYWYKGALNHSEYAIANLEDFKVKANTTYSILIQNYSSFIYVVELNADKQEIKSTQINNGKGTFTTTTGNYIRFCSNNSSETPLGLDAKIQIEEGTQATPYEPYQEDKLTILSPVQLEKVGDVADRIICKEGVWGVEKNIGELVIDGDSTIVYWIKGDTTVGVLCRDSSIINTSNLDKVNAYCNVLPSTIQRGFTSRDVEGVCVWDANNQIAVKVLKSKLSSEDTLGVKQWLQDNNAKIMYPLAEPQFIPLPHDQQIKLRTFANRTNISFLTEIEPTLKAQVPKSLGATVNSHTTQIYNLNKELDRVKKLEESTVSTVEAESNFTTVTETSNGYFEDVKLEGKTLVNLATTKNISLSTTSSTPIINTTRYDFNTTYTIIFESDRTDQYIHFQERNGDLWVKTIKSGVVSGINIIKFTSSLSGVNGIRFGAGSSASFPVTLSNFVLLEGDHTDKDISYFEGLKSVGQDVEEVNIKSINKNLIDINIDNWEKGSINNNTGENANTETRIRMKHFGRLPQNVNYLSFKYFGEYKLAIRFYDMNFKGIDCSNTNYSAFVVTSKIEIPNNAVYYRLVCAKNSEELIEPSEIASCMCCVELNDVAIISYIEPKQDRKQILYFNPNTQTWEKPVLREWDSIEKHSDGKYYYHKRSGEIVFNGSEHWHYPESQAGDNTVLFYSRIHDSKINQNYPICNMFSGTYLNIWESTIDIEGILINHNKDCILRLNKAKLPTQNVDGVKKWLQANPVTVVYQLAQEEAYECTNLDLITYSGETNLIVNSGAIQPKLELKVLSNVSNVVKLLQEKVSVLENKFIEGLKQVLSGNMMALAQLLYPEDFENNHEIQTLEL